MSSSHFKETFIEDTRYNPISKYKIIVQEFVG
jgi:hypothetical protein